MLKFSSKAQNTLCGHVLLPGRQEKGLVSLVLRHALVRPVVCLPFVDASAVVSARKRREIQMENRRGDSRDWYGGMALYGC